MCTPNAISSETLLRAIGITTDVSYKISDYKKNKENYEYRTQVALNNAKIAQNEAMKQKQLGIEKSRSEKIEGLKKIDKLKAHNSASNLDLMSSTNLQAYEDALNMSEIKADIAQKEYDASASDYFAKANEYFNQADTYKKEYKKSFLNFSINSLGSFNKVANNWYGNERNHS